MNTYLGNLTDIERSKKSQNQWALFTNQVSALIRPPYVLSIQGYSLVYPYLHYCASVWGSNVSVKSEAFDLSSKTGYYRIVSRSCFDAQAHANPFL